MLPVSVLERVTLVAHICQNLQWCTSNGCASVRANYTLVKFVLKLNKHFCCLTKSSKVDPRLIAGNSVWPDTQKSLYCSLPPPPFFLLARSQSLLFALMEGNNSLENLKREYNLRAIYIWWLWNVFVAYLVFEQRCACLISRKYTSNEIMNFPVKA